MNKNFITVALFELKEVIRKPSFWLSTLFLPFLIGVISFVSGYASIEAAETFENIGDEISAVYVIDDAGVINESFYQGTLVSTEREHYEEKVDEIKEDSSKILVSIGEDFRDSYEYEVIYNKGDKLLTGVTTAPVINSLIKQSVMVNIDDSWSQKVLSSEPKSTTMVFNKDGELVTEGIEQYILPIASLIVFFLTVFISSSFLLQSVSAEKENRMIETMLSIIDKRSLIFGKMLGLTGVVFIQLALWVGLGVGVYILGQNYFDLQLPIDLTNLDLTLLPVNILLTFLGFVFFAGIMTGVGAVGTGAQDSKNLSSVFIILSIFPMYLMQILVAQPNGTLARVFSYFPFTSHMVLLIRNSLGALSSMELVVGIVASFVYSAVALWIAYKLFELGCLMYNRRPTGKEILSYFGSKKAI